jgi:ATP-dependent helicase/nuclease subunit A
VPIAGSATLSPSDFGGAKALPGEGGLTEDEAKLRGTRIHSLLEILPSVAPIRREETGHLILTRGDDPMRPDEAEPLVQAVLRVLAMPELKWMFSPDALTEVPISANIDALGGRRVHGTIDRLLVAEDRVLAIDYKTNMVVPADPRDCPEGILRQMGAYAAALELVFRGRLIETAILWTHTATYMPLPHEMVIQALRRSTLT